MIAGRLRAAGKMWTRAAGKVWTSGRQSGMMDLVPESGRQKILKKLQNGVDKSGRQGYDGTISQSGREQEMITLQQATAIRQSVEADYEANPTTENLKRLQAAGKREMDLYLEGFDARQAARQEATQAPEQEVEEATEAAEIDSDSSTWSEERKEAYRQETARMMARISRSMDESNARVAGPADTRKFAKEYSQYISDGIGDTDGWFSPLSYEAWVRFFAPQD